MNCAYPTKDSKTGKKQTCPSHAHEMIAVDPLDPKDFTAYCSHHRRVVEAKLTRRKEKVND